jgi:segregation and condensation protein B
MNEEAKVEAVLFLSGRFMSLQELIAFTGINPISLKEILARLQQKYASDESGITIINNNEFYKMDVKPQFAELVNKLATGSSEFSKAEQETLAIIAHKQPITQAVVVKIRGNKAYEHIKKFIDAGLIKAKKAGRTLLLSLDQKFYDYFSIKK